MTNHSDSISHMRENYAAGTLRRDDLALDPFEQFSKWFNEAVEAKIREPNAMTLATIGLDGIPTARTLLLKGVEAGDGLSFFTNYESRKGAELADNPRASLLFFWKELERQVQIRGRVEKVSREISEAYFFSRPYASRIGAWVSEQSTELPNREWLETRDTEFLARFPDTGKPDDVPLPPYWGGYQVLPDSLEFWQGQPNRLHDRFIYEKVDDAPSEWSIRRLSP